jgi:hypothetical protein
MHSEEFIRRSEAGELNNDAEYFDGFAAKRRLDLSGRDTAVLGPFCVLHALGRRDIT